MTTQETTQGRDVVDFLRSQHQEIRSLFSAVESGQGEARRDAFECLVRLLAVHETAEEEIVYPTLRSTPGGDVVADARLEEEGQAKQMLSDLEKLGPDDPAFPQQLVTLRTAVIAHAQSEEQSVFPRLRENVDADKLTTMTSAVETAEKMAPTHPHPHGPESATGNILVGPFVAIADRVRDALRGANR